MGMITVSNLGKAYKQYPNRWARLLEWFDPRNHAHHTKHWVLQGISFTVQPGEAVGIVGMNGAGKSTLLKMITGTVQPTTGSVHITGRVAALLELGMGFHPDFTGRQNAFMAGQLLGYSVEDIHRLMPSIEAFAEIGDYMDQPVRVYSSGMQMRLAFSVATAQRPDVLIVDEALSVGDAYFVHKSFSRIKEFREYGTTLLIVSHDKGAIQSICDRAILLNAGAIAMEGLPYSVMDYYNALMANDQNNNRILMSESGTIEESGNGSAKIIDIKILNILGEEIKVTGVGDEIIVSVKVVIEKYCESLVLGCGFKDKYGQMIFGTNSYHLGKELTNCKPGEEYLFFVSFKSNLGVGAYSLNLAIHSGSVHLIESYQWIDRAAILEVVNFNKYEFVGLSWNPMNFSIYKYDTNTGAYPAVTPEGKEIIMAQAHYGPMLVYKDDQVIGKSLLEQGEFQERKITDVLDFIFNKFAFRFDGFVDIGANIGTHTIFSLKKGGLKHAICFEPNEDNFKLLRSNLILNDLEAKVICEKLALSNFSGEIEMELSNFNRGDHRIKAKSTNVSFGEEDERSYDIVPVMTLDSYADDHNLDWSKSIVWMDTQGHEGFIFSGASRFFAGKCAPKFLVVEFWPYGIERSSGHSMYFEFLSKCKVIYELGIQNKDEFGIITVDQLNLLYKKMLNETKKEYHPHTDLLLAL
jgi:lipopolysaccharide transport system ATP-binding protein